MSYGAWHMTSGSTTIHKVLFLAWYFRINELWTIWGSFWEARQANQHYLCAQWKYFFFFKLAALKKYILLIGALHNEIMTLKKVHRFYTGRTPLKIGFCTWVSWPLSKIVTIITITACHRLGGQGFCCPLHLDIIWNIRKEKCPPFFCSVNDCHHSPPHASQWHGVAVKTQMPVLGSKKFFQTQKNKK